MSFAINLYKMRRLQACPKLHYWFCCCLQGTWGPNWSGAMAQDIEGCISIYLCLVKHLQVHLGSNTRHKY